MRNMLAGMLILMAMAAVVNAAVITGVSAEANDYYQALDDPYSLGAVSGEPNAVVNNSGFNEELGWHYNDMRGIVEFEFEGEPATAINGPDTMWIASMDIDGAGTKPSISFDLGAAQRVTRIKVWNANSVGNTTIPGIGGDGSHISYAKCGRLNMGVQTMDIVLLDDLGQSITNGTILDYPIDKASGRADEDFGQSIDLTGTGANLDAVRYVRFDIQSNYGDVFGQVALSEVRFYNDDTTVTVDAGSDFDVTIGSAGADPNVLVSLSGTVVTSAGLSEPNEVSWFLYGAANVFARNLGDPNGIALKDPNVVVLGPVALEAHATEPDTYISTVTAAISMPGIYDFGVQDVASGILDFVRVRVFASDTDDGLIGYWKFDEVDPPENPFPFYDGVHEDETAGDHDGMPTGSPGTEKPQPSPTEGVFGGALIYSRTGGVEVQDPEMVIEVWPDEADPYDRYFSSQMKKEMTYSAWYKVDGTLPTTGEATLGMLAKGPYNMWAVNDAIHFNMTLDQVGREGYYPNYRGVGTTKITDGKWHHVALIYDGFSTKLYVDGRLDCEVFTYDQTELFDPGGQQNIRIGARGGNDLSFVGYVDDVKMYRVAKDQAWAIAEYESAGLGSACTTPLQGDLDDDCDADIDDLILLAQDWLL